MNCPVCKWQLPQQVPPFCPQCAWDLKNDLTLNTFLSPIPEKDFADYRERLNLAKKNWGYLQDIKKKLVQSEPDKKQPQRDKQGTAFKQQSGNEGKTSQQYDPDLVPDLKRDPFETQEEFVERRAKRPYYVGEIELLVDSYDINTGKFPVQFANVRQWAQDLVKPLNEPLYGVHLLLPREQARVLYQEGRVWPVYAWLKVAGDQIRFKALKTLTPLEEQLLLYRECGSVEIERDGVYVLYDNGIIEDTKTGLEWKIGPGKDTNWEEAKSWVQSINFDVGGWRMPTTDELKDLYLYQKSMGSHNITLLLKTTSPYLGIWSGETKGSSAAWAFDFIFGSRDLSDRDGSYGLRALAVRSRNVG